MKILVPGGTGKVGREVVQWLNVAQAGPSVLSGKVLVHVIKPFWTRNGDQRV